jgi:hypothetical protein
MKKDRFVSHPYIGATATTLALRVISDYDATRKQVESRAEDRDHV